MLAEATHTHRIKREYGLWSGYGLGVLSWCSTCEKIFGFLADKQDDVIRARPKEVAGPLKEKQ